MKKFSFSLEKVLELKAYRERESEIELGRAIGALTAVEQEIQDVAKKRVEAASLRFLPGRKSAEIYNTDLYIIRLDKLKDKLFEDAAKAELVVAAAREKYIEASRERKVLDKLREKRLQEYKKNLMNEEIKELDDISNGRQARQSILGGS
ncbi:flagellar export protein FliJ [Breznakiella homolactica]|uniref:Flagellar FliJ protein n=1 Tax=Breznakiella homolactica TaxID=2798577 RepID=A0A7T7XJI7_9SPIR|nr:flagellar export protein FliJ [Breznakiella homolactica]QQO07418.1 flagellar export protein FliJ [Breznakiella homolactica]